MKNIRCEKANNNEEWITYVAKLIFDEWIKKDYSHFLEKKKKMEQDANVKPYVILDNDVPIGCFLITYNDIKGYPQYNPNLSCVCVQREHRGKGYGNYILQYSLIELKKMDTYKAYLKTSLVNFYQKVGWKPLNEVCDGERIYEIKLK